MATSETDIKNSLVLLEEALLLLSGGVVTERDQDSLIAIIESAQALLDPASTDDERERARAEAEGVVGPQQQALGGWSSTS